MSTGGDIIYGGASGTGTRLPNGSASQVLTSAGGTAAPTWETPSGSAPFTIDDTGTRSMTILQEQNVSFAGIECTFYGTQAGLDNTTGDHNTLYGHNCDLDDSDDDDATGMGHDVIVRERGVAIGAQADASGVQPTAIGQASVCTGNNSVAIGITAGASGTDSVVIGAASGRSTGGGSNVVFVGKGAGLNATGTKNVGIGHSALSGNTGGRNVAVGQFAGLGSGSGADNVYIGNTCGNGLTDSDRLMIENSANNTTPLIDGQFTTKGGTRPEFIKINGRFQTTWTVVTATFTAIAGDQLLCDTDDTGAFTVTLPAGVDGDEVAFADAASNWGTDNLTVAADGAETVLGAASQVINGDNEAVRLVFYGTNWVVAP